MPKRKRGQRSQGVGRSRYGRKKRITRWSRSIRSRYRNRKSRYRKAIRVVPRTVLVKLPWVHELDVPYYDNAGGPLMLNLSRMYKPNNSTSSVIPSTFDAFTAQPRGYDQWQALYNSYVVLSATVKIELLFTDRAVSCCDLIARLDDNGVFTNPQDTPRELIEARIPHRKLEVRSQAVGVQNNIPAVAPTPDTSLKTFGARGRNRIWMKYNLKKFFKPGRGDIINYTPDMGLTDQFLGEDAITQYQALANPQAGQNISPVKECCLKIYNYAYREASAAANLADSQAISPKIRVTIQYVALLANPKQVTSSDA